MYFFFIFTIRFFNKNKKKIKKKTNYKRENIKKFTCYFIIRKLNNKYIKKLYLFFFHIKNMYDFAINLLKKPRVSNYFYL